MCPVKGGRKQVSGQGALIQNQQEPFPRVTWLFSLEVFPTLWVEAVKGWPEGPAPMLAGCWAAVGVGWALAAGLAAV